MESTLMEKFWISMAKTALNALVSTEARDKMAEMITELFDVDISNDEKRARVKKVISPMVSSFVNLFLSSLISFTVDSLRYGLEQKGATV